nr:MAG TPA_asm: hypothetical protein [Caudoviricetes sp.]
MGFKSHAELLLKLIIAKPSFDESIRLIYQNVTGDFLKITKKVW